MFFNIRTYLTKEGEVMFFYQFKQLSGVLYVGDKIVICKKNSVRTKGFDI